MNLADNVCFTSKVIYATQVSVGICLKHKLIQRLRSGLHEIKQLIQIPCDTIKEAALILFDSDVLRTLTLVQQANHLTWIQPQFLTLEVEEV